MSVICISPLDLINCVTLFDANGNDDILKTHAEYMTTITNAEELRNKVNRDKEIAKKYGVQQNLLIALKNLNDNPPSTEFDIGLPPYNHQSHLWDYGLEKSVLYDLAKHLEMDFIDNNEIKDYVFQRMYEPKITLEILGETIFLLKEKGFRIKFDSFLGCTIPNLDSLLTSEIPKVQFLDHFVNTSLGVIAANQKELTPILVDASQNRSYDRAPNVESIGFVPNIGLSISFD